MKPQPKSFSHFWLNSLFCWGILSSCVKLSFYQVLITRILRLNKWGNCLNVGIWQRFVCGRTKHATTDHNDWLATWSSEHLMWAFVYSSTREHPTFQQPATRLAWRAVGSQQTAAPRGSNRFYESGNVFPDRIVIIGRAGSRSRSRRSRRSVSIIPDRARLLTRRTIITRSRTK